MIFWVLLIWTVCGILSYGFVLGEQTSNTKYPYLLGIVVGLWGPIGLVWNFVDAKKELRFRLW